MPPRRSPSAAPNPSRRRTPTAVCPEAERIERAVIDGMAHGEARVLNAGEWSDIRQQARHSLVRSNDLSRRGVH